MNFHSHSDRGLVKTIILVVIALLILSYFGFNLRTIVASETFQDNWSFVKNLIVDVWNDYLKAPVIYLWDIFWRLIWNPAIDLLENAKSVKTTL